MSQNNVNVVYCNYKEITKLLLHYVNVYYYYYYYYTTVAEVFFEDSTL